MEKDTMSIDETIKEENLNIPTPITTHTHKILLLHAYNNTTHWNNKKSKTTIKKYLENNFLL
jgi:hypothetical protein